MKLKVEVTIVDETEDWGYNILTRWRSYKRTIESPVLTLEMSVDSKLELIAAIIEVAEKDNPIHKEMTEAEIKKVTDMRNVYGNKK